MSLSGEPLTEERMVNLRSCLLKALLITATAHLAAAPATAPSPAATAGSPEKNIRRDVEILASPEMGGRLAGSPGGKLAVEHIASEFKKVGLVPPPEMKDYY